MTTSIPACRPPPGCSSREQLRVAAATFAENKVTTTRPCCLLLPDAAPEPDAVQPAAQRPEQPAGLVADPAAAEGLYSSRRPVRPEACGLPSHLTVRERRRGVAGWVSIRPNGELGRLRRRHGRCGAAAVSRRGRSTTVGRGTATGPPQVPEGIR